MRSWRQVRETRAAADAEQLTRVRTGVHALMSEYECDIVDGVDWVDVSGGEGTCRFRADQLGGVVLLDAGTEGEFVSEWVFHRKVTVEDFLDLLRRILAGEGIGRADRLGDGQLTGYQPYRRRADGGMTPGGG